MGLVELIAMVTIGSLSWLLGLWLSPERRQRRERASGGRVRSLEVYRTLHGPRRSAAAADEQGRVIPLRSRDDGAGRGGPGAP